jgi:hypothetical protein
MIYILTKKNSGKTNSAAIFCYFRFNDKGEIILEKGEQLCQKETDFTLFNYLWFANGVKVVLRIRNPDYMI